MNNTKRVNGCSDIPKQPDERVPQQTTKKNTLSLEDTQQLVQELLIYQQSLEQQNKELRNRYNAIEEALHTSTQRYKRLLQTVTDYIYIVEAKGNCPVTTYHGPGCTSVTGYTPEELDAQPALWYQIIHPDERALVAEQATRVLSGRNVAPLEHRIIHKDGTIRWVRNTLSPHYNEHGVIVAYDGLITDITERKRTEEALYRAQAELEMRVQERTAELIQSNRALQDEITERKRMQHELNLYTQHLQANERRFRTIIEKSADGIIIVDQNGIVRFVNPVGESMFGHTAAELIGESFGFPMVSDGATEIDVIRRDGKTGVAEMRVVETAWEGTHVYLATFRDITKRKQSETRRTIRYSIANILSQDVSIWQAANDILQPICAGTRWEYGETWLLDPDTNLLHWVGCWHFSSLQIQERMPDKRTLTFDPERGLYGAVWASRHYVWITNAVSAQKESHASAESLWSWPTIAAPANHLFQTAIAFPICNGHTVVGILAFFSRAHHQTDEELSKMMLEIGHQMGQFLARRKAEEELRSTHRALRTLNECNQALIHATDESEFLHDICRIIVEVGGYLLSWAGFAEQDSARHVRIVARAGYEHRFIDSLDITWGTTDRSYGPTSTAIRNGVPCVARNIQADPTYASWQPQATECGFASSVALPLINNLQVFGVLNIYAAEPDAFGKEEVKLLMEMAHDLAYGIVALRTRAERDQAEKDLRLYAERLKNMREIDQAILTAQTPSAIAQAAMSHIRQLVPYQWASIVGLDATTNESVTFVNDIQTTDLETPLFATPGARLPTIPPHAPDGLQHGTVRYVKDIETVSKPTSTLTQLSALGIRSYISAPLIADNQLIGEINLGATMPDAFAPQHLSIVREVADQMAIAIHHARLFEQVRAGRERLKTLSRRLMEGQEQERHHIARELHDEIGQSLTAVKMSLQAIVRVPDSKAISSQLKESMTIVDHALQQVRNLSLDLRPSLLDDLGLVAALRWYVDRQAQWTGLDTEFIADTIATRLPPDLETACFRVTQEAFTNIVRHARAHHVYVKLQQNVDELQLIIRDDGIGFNVQAAEERATRGSSLGLLGMQERVFFAGGKMEIVSRPERGTEIHARFPIQESALPIVPNHEQKPKSL